MNYTNLEGVGIVKITNELGQEIIKRLAEYIEVDINIMDLNGEIVASTDESRIHEIHSGAIEVIRTNREIILDEVDLQHYPGTKPGANLKITHQDKIVGVVGVSGRPRDILSITGLIKVAVEVIINQLHIHRQAYYQERQWNYWLHQLLHPNGFNKDQLEKEAIYSLDINTEHNWRVILMYGKKVQTYIDLIRQKLADMKIKPLFSLLFLEREIVITIPADFERLHFLTDYLIQITKSELRVGVGGVAAGLEGIRESYQQAKQALSFSDEYTEITYSENLAIERLVSAIPQKVYDQVCDKYEYLLDLLKQDYQATLDTYLRMNTSIKKTASMLYIHRNTLLYRLDQITDKTGLDPRVFHDAFLLNIIRSKQKTTVQMNKFNQEK